MLTLGWASGRPNPITARRMTELGALLARLSGIPFTIAPFEQYADLTQAVFAGDVDVAWLPPIPFLALVTRSAVAPLASVRHSPYQSAIIVAKDSPLKKPASLIGHRAAWVDRHSAAGFVIPRVKLARFGIDPRTALAAELFLGSHDEVVAAVAKGEVAFGATWAMPGSRGAITGPWSRTPFEVRVLATFGNIPPDVIAARADLPQPMRKQIVRALKAVREDHQSKWLVSHVLGTRGFYRPKLELYRSLQNTVVEAYEAGLLTEAPTEPTTHLTPAEETDLTPIRPVQRSLLDTIMELERVPADTSGPFELEEIEIDVSFD